MSGKISSIKVAPMPGVLNPEEIIPERRSDGAVGYDLKAIRHLKMDKSREPISDSFPVTIEPGGKALFGPGFAMSIPEGYEGQIRPRSGMSMNDIVLANQVGTIDPDYRGEVGVCLRNDSEKAFVVNQGDSIAQLLITEVQLPGMHLVESVEDLPETKRGTGGFGSTGMSGAGHGTATYKAQIHNIDCYLMGIAISTSALSDCVRGCKLNPDGTTKRDDFGILVGQTRRFGAVFARGARVLSTGFNHQVKGQSRCAEVGCLRDAEKIPSGHRLERCRAIHAEEDAIMTAGYNGISLKGSTLYVNAEPCQMCSKSIASLSLKAVVILSNSYPESGVDIIENADIQVRTISMNDVRRFQGIADLIS